MEPKIQDGDLVLIHQQESYDPNNYVFVVHNQLPKLKKIVKNDEGVFLESVNRKRSGLKTRKTVLDFI